MKGVIVQVGHPKSIVLFNDGKIRAILTPENCQVGMVITVKFNSLLKIIIISLATILLLALGIFIGTTFFGGTADPPPNEPIPGLDEDRGRGPRRQRRMMENWRPPPLIQIPKNNLPPGPVFASWNLYPIYRTEKKNNNK